MLLGKKKKRGVEKKYNEMDVLADIYRLRGLTIDQIAEAYFGGTKNYVYRWLQRIQEEGYLDEMYLMETRERNKVRKAKLYYATDKAIELLEKENMLVGKKRTAAVNKPTPQKLKYLIWTNDIYAAVAPYGIYFIDSREWKARFGMDRNALVRGGIRLQDGTEYAIYAFFNEERKNGGTITERQVTRLIEEINKNPQSNRVIILCYDPATYKAIGDAYAKAEVKRQEICLIPYGRDGVGIDMIRIRTSQEARKKQLESVLNVRLIENHEALRGQRQLFASYIAEKDDEEYYVVDYLNLNLVALKNLENLYHVHEYKKDGRKVKLVCWAETEARVADILRVYHHVDIVPVSRDYLHKWLEEEKRN